MRGGTWIGAAALTALLYVGAGEGLAGKGGGGGGGGGNTTLPDFAYNAFTNSGARELWVIQDDGTGAMRVAPANVLASTGFGGGAHHSWSPDGTRLAFLADFGSGLGLGVYIVNVDGTGLRRITDHGGGTNATVQWCPVPAPDGREWLAVCEDTDPTAEVEWREVSLVCLDGERVPVTHGLTPPDVPRSPRGGILHGWASDGRRLLCSDPSTTFRIYTLDFDESGNWVVPTATSGWRNFVSDVWDDHVDWARDSDRIVMAVGADPGTDLWIVDFTDPDALIYTRLTTTVDDSELKPVWSPDDREILFIDRYYKSGGNRVWSTTQILTLATGARRTLPTLLPNAQWRPNLP